MPSLPVTPRGRRNGAIAVRQGRVDGLVCSLVALREFRTADVAEDSRICPAEVAVGAWRPSRGRDVCSVWIRVVRLSETLSLSRGRHAGLPARGLGSRTP